MVRPLQGSLTGSSGSREAPDASGGEDYHLERAPFGLALSALVYQSIVLSMSSDKKTPDEIKAEIAALSKQLEEGLHLETQAKSKLAIKAETEYQALLTRMVGRRVLITLDGDFLYGKEAIILRPRGKSKHPMYWWLQPLGDSHGEVYKAHTSFKLLPLKKGETDDTGH